VRQIEHVFSVYNDSIVLVETLITVTQPRRQREMKFRKRYGRAEMCELFWQSLPKEKDLYNMFILI
jgi:hypothetical protein